MNHHSVQFRSKEERQRDDRLCSKHARLEMPAVQAAHALARLQNQADIGEAGARLAANGQDVFTD